MLDELLGGALPVCLSDFQTKKIESKVFYYSSLTLFRDIQGQFHSKDLCLFIERVKTVKVNHFFHSNAGWDSSQSVLSTNIFTGQN